MSALYPWLVRPWQHLLNNKARPAQALLISGSAGIGKSALAYAWAQTLLCEAPRPDGDACNECGACHWFKAGTHPDFRLLTLQEKENKDGETTLATGIDVEQARETVDFVRSSAYRAGRRVVLVEPADALNVAAANALLKVLEEPPLNTTFLLVSDQPRRLLPTVRSRCTRLDVGLPPQEDALRWLRDQQLDNAEEMLALASGAPLAAVKCLEEGGLTVRKDLFQVLSKPSSLDPVMRADTWKNLNPRVWHILTYKWLCDVLATRLKCAARFNPDYSEALLKLGKHVDLARLLALSKAHVEQGRYVMHPLNRQLQLETWLIQYRQLFIEDEKT
ncbi:MAG: DNA polymerase III subunit delta' [Thiobacillaceae bacterium]